ncbi:hypothetical protein TI03_01890 [Achromatium sp. WMS1]|nr:hypothetical protein TI03_01890 [Achromatium sp. WMS1]
MPMLSISLLLSSCERRPDLNSVQLFCEDCQNKHEHCQTRERQDKRPVCKALYGFAQKCQSYGTLVAGSREECAKFAISRMPSSSNISAKTRVGLVLICNNYCRTSTSSDGFPSFTAFEIDKCKTPDEDSKCTPCPAKCKEYK